MSKIKILDSKDLSKKELLSYVESLGGSISTSDSAIDTVGNTFVKYDIKSKDPLHKHQLITEVCRKLDTNNIQYEVDEWEILFFT